MERLQLDQFWVLLKPFNKHRLAGALGVSYETCMQICNHWRDKRFTPERALLIEGVSGGKVRTHTLAPIYDWSYIVANRTIPESVKIPFVIDINNQEQEGVMHEVD